MKNSTHYWVGVTVNTVRLRKVIYGGQMGRWGDGEMGRWGDGEMGRWGDGEMGENFLPVLPILQELIRTVLGVT